MSALPKGTMDVRILDDGTVRVETGDMGQGVEHKSADDFVKLLAKLMGGEEVVEKTKHGHQHHHEHAHGDDHIHH